MNTPYKSVVKILFVGLLLAQLTGCARDTEALSQSLMRSESWSKTQADCYAERLANIMDGKSFDRVLSLMQKQAGLSEAMTMARRATGKSYSAIIHSDAELKACIGEP